MPGIADPGALPETVVAPCPHPSDVVSRGTSIADAEISILRLGNELIECGAEKALLLRYGSDVREAVRSGR